MPGQRRHVRRGTLVVGSEAHHQAQVLTLAKVYGWRAYHTHDSRRSAPGFPDLVLVRGPRLLFVELKTETGKLSEPQADWLDALGAVAAAIYMLRVGAKLRGVNPPAEGWPSVETFVWRPSDWELIEEVLKR